MFQRTRDSGDQGGPEVRNSGFKLDVIHDRTIMPVPHPHPSPHPDPRERLSGYRKNSWAGRTVTSSHCGWRFQRVSSRLRNVVTDHHLLPTPVCCKLLTPRPISSPSVPKPFIKTCSHLRTLKKLGVSGWSRKFNRGHRLVNLQSHQ